MYEILKDFQVLAAGILAVFAAGIGFAGVWHRLDLKLEKAKTEMQSAYSALKVSADLTLAGQGEYRAKVIEGVQELWNAILAVQGGRDHLLEDKGGIYDDILVATSRRRGQQAADISQISERVSMKHLVFVGDKLWHRFLSIMNFYLCIDRLEDKQVDWRDDKLLISVLHQNLIAEMLSEDVTIDVAEGAASDVVEVVKKQGLKYAVALLETAFLREARRIMTGSQEFADSLSGSPPSAWVKLSSLKL